MDGEKIKLRAKRFGHDLLFSVFELAFWIAFLLVACLVYPSFEFYRRVFSSLFRFLRNLFAVFAPLFD